MRSLTNFDDNGNLRTLNSSSGNADDSLLTTTETKKLPPSTTPSLSSSSSSSSPSSKPSKRAKISSENGTTDSAAVAGVLASLSAPLNSSAPLVDKTTGDRNDIDAEMEATNNTQVSIPDEKNAIHDSSILARQLVHMQKNIHSHDFTIFFKLVRFVSCGIGFVRYPND